MPLSSNGSIRPLLTRKQFLIVTIAFLSFIALALGIRSLIADFVSSRWSTIREDREHRIAVELQSQFSDFERRAFADVDSVAGYPETDSLFSIGIDSVRQAMFFERILPRIREETSIELYDEEGDLIGWSGARGPSIDLPENDKKPRSFVIEDPIYSYLIIIVPVNGADSTRGYIVGKKLIEVNYPINNRFINSKVLAGTFASQIDWNVQFEFHPGETLSHDSLRLHVNLLNLAGERIGSMILAREELSTVIERWEQYCSRLADLLGLGLIVIIILYGATQSAVRNSPTLRMVVVTFALWLVRYVLIWIDFPGSYFLSALFDPMKFGSSFGFGLAKSIGDMFLSALVLGANVTFIAVAAAGGIISGWSTKKAPGKLRGIVAFVFVVGCALLLAGLIRGFAATVHSAVFDADLPYNDPTFVLPPLDLGIMLLSLIVIAASLIIAAIVLICLAWNVARSSSRHGGSGFRTGLWFSIVFLIVGLFFGALQVQPLMSPLERAISMAAFALVALLVSALYRTRQRVFEPAAIFCIVIVAFMLLVPILDDKVHALDRVHVELMANEMISPTDSWLTLLVNRSLSELADTASAGILMHGDTLARRSLAFRQWAKSTLSKEGNNCSIGYMDENDSLVSEFHIGASPHAYTKRSPVIPATSPSVTIEEKTVNGRAVKWYVGYAAMRSDSGTRIGGVRVEITGSRESMLKGEAPEFLRSGSRESFRTHFRPMVLSEYYQGKLLFSTGETIPQNRTLPPIISREKVGQREGIWVEENIEGEQYESLYIPEESAKAEDSWIALSMPSLDVRWHVYSFLRYVIFFLLIAAAGIALVILVRFIHGEHLRTTFRQKLMAAFVAVSLIPVVILVYYNRLYAVEQSDEFNTKRLGEQTTLVVSELQESMMTSVPAALTRLRDDLCAGIADEVDVDFNVYYGHLLQASSKPEMFVSELLDTRLSAAAYREIILKKKKFFVEYQRIGTLPYVVGYRPLVAADGSVMGVVSVPSLYRQIEINEDVTRRSVFLYGAYGVALLLAVVAGTTFANQISRPIRRLTVATREVGTGKLDVLIHRQSHDELGELEQAFQEMTDDLKRSQQEIIKAQREMAWREMAKQVAHEIKNPLTPMKLSVQHLRKAFRDGAHDFGGLLEQVSNTLLEQIDALSRIASEFSHFARMPERVIDVCSINDVLLEARNLFQQERIHFDIDMDPSAPVVVADREELRRAFINLLRNAVQAMKGEGRVRLSTKRINDTVEICVSDIGTGIPPEIMSRLFEPNFSTKTDGMGLGLPIVKRIVDDLGGTIDVQSTLASGTTVCIRLPIRRNVAS